MVPLRTLGAIGVAAAGVLAVAALVSQQSPPSPSSKRAEGPAPQIQFVWSVSPPPGAKPSSPPLAMRGTLTEGEHQMRRRKPRHHAVAREHQEEQPEDHHRTKHHHKHSEVARSLTGSDVSAAPVEPPEQGNEKGLSVVKQRLRDGLSSELYKDFDLFLYVSKAATGPLAQRMYVYRKNKNGGFDLLYDWPVSTGRERVEYNSDGVQLPSFTPAGYYELDSHRFFRNHTSTQWQQPMPFAMFFDWMKDGTPTGLAIHAATGSDIAALGTRASAGCVRLAPEAAKTLYTLIRARYRGLIPRFEMDHRTRTISNEGVLVHDSHGKPELREGYKVLVMIENYGGSNVIAAMY